MTLHTIDTATTAPNDVESPAPVRLTLLSTEAGRPTTLDGAWWPRSRSLTDELPALVEDLDRRGTRVARVSYHPDAWDMVPRRLMAHGRVIRLGWFRRIDPHLVSLTGSFGRERVELLVVPPETDRATSSHAMAMAARPGNRDAPTAILAAARVVARDSTRVPVTVGVPRPRDEEPAEDRPAHAVWESEGGRLRRQAARGIR